MTKNQTVIFVGKRAGAIQAARHLGRTVILLADSPPGKKDRDIIATFIDCDFYDQTVDWSALAEDISRKQSVAAVCALTERTVLPAAMLRQSLGLPGLQVEMAHRCTDKFLMKQAIRKAGLQSADFINVEAGVSTRHYLDKLGLPLVLKTRVGSGGRGTTIYRHREAIPDTLPQGWLAESFIDGLEMSVESFVYQGKPIFVNFTEYFKPGWANIIPAKAEPELTAAIQEVNHNAIKALGITQGMTHLEIYLTEQGIYFGELAARPPGGYIMELMQEAYGVNFWKRLIALELGQRPDFPTESQRYAGVWLLHPGPGQIRQIDGLAEARTLPRVKRISLRVQPGDEIGQREGVGQETGHIMVTGETRSEVATGLLRAHQLIDIQIASPAEMASATQR